MRVLTLNETSNAIFRNPERLTVHADRPTMRRRGLEPTPPRQAVRRRSAVTLAASLYRCPASEGLAKVIRLEHEGSLQPLRHGARPEGRRSRRAQTGPISLIEMPANDDVRNHAAARSEDVSLTAAFLCA